MSQFPGIVCRGCSKDDELYEDSHGVFCHRCGPSVPMGQTKVYWYAGVTLDKDSKMIHHTSDAKGGLMPCPNTVL